MTHRDTALTVKEPVWNENSTWCESNGHKRSCALIGSHILENKEILFIPRKGNSNQKSAPNFWRISTYLKWANMDLHSNAFISSVFIFSFNFSFLSFTLLFVCSPFLPFESIQSLSDIVNTCFSMLDLVYMVFYFDATPFLLISCFFLFCSRSMWKCHTFAIQIYFFVASFIHLWFVYSWLSMWNYVTKLYSIIVWFEGVRIKLIQQQRDNRKLFCQGLNSIRIEESAQSTCVLCGYLFKKYPTQFKSS